MLEGDEYWKQEGRLREIGRWGDRLVPPTFNRHHWKKSVFNEDVKEVKSSMWYRDGTDSSLACVISFGPHRNPIKAGTVMINFKLRLKVVQGPVSRQERWDPSLLCEMPLADGMGVSLWQ